MTERFKKRLNVVLLSILVTIIFTSIGYKHIKPVILDLFPRSESAYFGYKDVAKVIARDQDRGDTVKFKIIDVFPKHDFRIDSLSGLIQMNCANLKYDQYKIWVLVYDTKGASVTKSYIIHNIEKH